MNVRRHSLTRDLWLPLTVRPKAGKVLGSQQRHDLSGYAGANMAVLVYCRDGFLAFLRWCDLVVVQWAEQSAEDQDLQRQMLQPQNCAILEVLLIKL